MASPTLWDAHPLEHFTTFVKSPAFVLTSVRSVGDDPSPISDESASIYCFMFGKFVQWLTAEKKRFSQVDQQDLVRFLNHCSEPGRRDLNSKIRYRYLRLLERCYQHLQAVPNPAQHEILSVYRTGSYAKDQGMVTLTKRQLADFLAALPSPGIPAGRRDASWKRRRDRAMQLVMLLGGLRVAEAIGLLLGEVGKQIHTDGSIDLEITPEGKHDTSYEHSTVLRSPGGVELHRWLDERAELAIPGQLAFPADLQGNRLNKATVYRQVKATFARAGIKVDRSGGRTLRNTFAVTEFVDGATTERVTEYMGLARERSTDEYSRLAKGQK